MAAFHLPQQFRRRVTTALALVISGQTHQCPGVEAGVQGAAPAFRRAGGPGVHALGVGLPHIHGPWLRDGGIQHLEGTLQILVVREEVGTQ